MDVEEADDGYDPVEEAKKAARGKNQESKDQFNHQMSERMKARGDLFDEMVVHEEKIRLGDPGWKARYYEVRLLYARQRMLTWQN